MEVGGTEGVGVTVGVGAAEGVGLAGGVFVGVLAGALVGGLPGVGEGDFTGVVVGVLDGAGAEGVGFVEDERGFRSTSVECAGACCFADSLVCPGRGRVPGVGSFGAGPAAVGLFDAEGCGAAAARCD
ncbi:MAG: hypothetical protein ACTHZK_05280, partial [Arthrobacter sp.]